MEILGRNYIIFNSMNSLIDFIRVCIALNYLIVIQHKDIAATKNHKK